MAEEVTEDTSDFVAIRGNGMTHRLRLVRAHVRFGDRSNAMVLLIQ